MITIIDYGVGNIGSIENSLKRIGASYQISGNVDEILQANALLLPGVGAARAGMENLKSRKLDKAIYKAVKNEIPLLGICLGMQLLFEYSEEGNTKCLGILKGTVKKFNKERKIPQVGWNQIQYCKKNIVKERENLKITTLLKNIPDNSSFYFVHSYICLPNDTSIIIAKTEYGEQFASVVAYQNITATQFHPEKSGEIGLRFQKNFMETL